MSLDALQRVWQSQDRPGRIAIDPELLLREIRRNREGFRTAILWRDFREVGVAVIMTGVFAYLAATGNGWPMWLLAGSMLWITAFMLVDRFRQRRRRPVAGEPILLCIQGSLREVEHQIWLLRNMFWWYLLPPGAAIAIYYGYVGWLGRSAPWAVVLTMAVGLLTGLFLWLVYRLNRRCVRRDLAPRRQELQELLKALTGNEDAPRGGAGTP